MRYLKYLAVVFLIFSSCSEQVVEPKRIRSDDNMIYETIFDEFVSDQNRVIVLNDSTHGEYSIYNNPEYFIENLSGLSTETLENYMNINKEKIRLKKIPNIDFVFESEYDNSTEHSVHVSVSRVGYNKQKTQAVVTIGVVYAPLVGAGAIIILIREGYEWKIKNTMMTWIS
jgi:hypothetical protein